MSLFPSSFNSLGKQYLREQRNINLKQDKKYNEGLKTFFGAPTPSNWKYDMSSTRVIFNGNDNPSFAEILNKNEKGEYLQKVLTRLRTVRTPSPPPIPILSSPPIPILPPPPLPVMPPLPSSPLSSRATSPVVSRPSSPVTQTPAPAPATEEAKTEEVKDSIKTTPVIRRLEKSYKSYIKKVMEAENVKTPNQKVYSSKDNNPLRVISDTTQFYTPVTDANEKIKYPSSTKATSLLHDLQQEDSDVEDDEDEAAAKEGEKSANGEIAEVLETETFTVSKLNKLVKLIDKATTTREAKMQIMQYLSKNKEKYEKAISAYNFRVQDSPLTSRKYNGENLMTALRSITE